MLGSVMRAETATGTHGPGLMYDDWDAGDDAKEFRLLVVTPPTSGTLFVYENGAFSLVGAPDGTYTLTYQLFVDGVDFGLNTETIIIGASGATATITGKQTTVLAGIIAAVGGAVAVIVGSPSTVSAGVVTAIGADSAVAVITGKQTTASAGEIIAIVSEGSATATMTGKQTVARAGTVRAYGDELPYVPDPDRLVPVKRARRIMPSGS